MSWKARRYQPGKPVLRAVRHRRKVLSKLEEEALRNTVPRQGEIEEAWRKANELKLDRLALMLRLAQKYREVDEQRIQYREAYLEEQAETSLWKLRWLQERQKVRALEAKIGSLRGSRQHSRTRMRAGGRTIRGTSRS